MPKNMKKVTNRCKKCTCNDFQECPVASDGLAAAEDELITNSSMRFDA